MQRSSSRGGSKPSASKKGYRNKAAQLEVAVRDKVNCLARLQSEAVFLRQKGSVLEQLLEVASEVAVHKRQHTGTKFPDLSDPQLLEFLEKFLDGYGGFAAERPTAHNYFNLQRLDVEQHKDVRQDEFVEKYTSLVQRLSLLLLQATDGILQGGLTTTMDDLKQLLLGTLLWSPITFMQVGTQNLQTGDEVMADPSHSDQAITGIQLTPEQEDVLVIIGELYNNQVATLEATHTSLSQVLDAELTSAGQGGAGGIATAIMHVSSNMHRLLAVHQLFHFAIMHNLLDQQLAHLCVRCFPRFPCMQDLLNALARIRGGHNKGARHASSEPAGNRGLSLGINLGSAAAGAATKAKPSVVQTSVLSRGLLAEAGSKLLHSSSRPLLSNSSGAGGSGAGVKEEGKSVGGGDGEGAEQQASGDATAAAAATTAEQAVPKSPLSDLADVIKSSGKDWDVAEIGALTPIKPDRSGAAAAPGSSTKPPRSPTPAAAGGSNRIGSGGAGRPGKKSSTAGGVTTAGYGSGSSSVQAGNKRARASDNDSKWAQQQQQGGHRQESGNSIDVNMAIVAAAAAAGMPVDPAAAAALPVPLDGLPGPAAAAAAAAPLQQQQQRPSSGVQQNALPAIQQLAAYLNAAQGPQDMMQLLASQPKLALLLQQQPELLGALQEAMAQQQQQQQAAAAAQQAGLPDFAAAAAAGAAALQGLHQQQQQHGYAASVGRASGADGLQQAGAGGRLSGLPTLEMLPPSLMAKDEPSSSPMQSLLQSLSTLLQACTSVPEAAAAALDMGPGQGDFVLSAVSAAEAACTTALRGLADIKARVTGSRGAALPSSSAAAAAGVHAGVMAAAAHGAVGDFAAVSLPASSSGRLHPPAGIPMPAGLHASQQMLPQSLSLALSGDMHTAEAPPAAQTHAALLAGLGLSQGLTQQQLPQKSRVAAGSRLQGFSATARPGAPGSSNALSSLGREAAAAAQQQQQPLSISSLVQQLSAVGDNPAALAQLVQILQSQQQLTPEVSAVLVQLAGAHQHSALAPAAPLAAAPAAEAPVSGVAALMQQLQKQAAGHAAVGMKQVAASGAQDAAAGSGGAWGAAARQGGQGLPVHNLPTSMAGPAAVSQGLAAAIDPAAAAAAAPVGPLPASAAAAAAAAAAGGAGATLGAGEAKEDSPSAGSSTTNTGQSGRPQHDGADAAAQAAQVQPGPDQQQHLDGLAQAAAAAMGGQLHAPGQAVAFISTVMQLLQGQVGTDGSSVGMGAVAGILQAMQSASAGPAAAGFAVPQQPQVHPAAAAAMAQPPPFGQSAAAAATMIPPAAAAAMAAKTAAAAAAAAGAPGAASGARQHLSDFADMEVDAVSALEMLAAAAVAEGPQHKTGGGRDR